MDQNETKVIAFDPKKAVENIVEKNEAIQAEKKNIFEALMSELQKVNPATGGLEELGAILSLPEEQFNIIAPIFLEELERSMNNIDDKLLLAQSMNITGTKLEDIRDSYMLIYEQIDRDFDDLISSGKRDFLKRLLMITYNCIAETEGVAKRIIQVPIELTSENAQIPKYAHLGDGAVDLYSPADYTINPGETVIIPCDIKVALPYGYAFLIHPRSGASAKTKLRVANSIGLVTVSTRVSSESLLKILNLLSKTLLMNLMIMAAPYLHPFYMASLTLSQKVNALLR